MATDWVYMPQAQAPSSHMTLSPVPKAQFLLIPPLPAFPFLVPGSVPLGSSHLLPLYPQASYDLPLVILPTTFLVKRQESYRSKLSHFVPVIPLLCISVSREWH